MLNISFCFHSVGLLLLVITTVRGQELVTLSGRVLGAGSGEPLEYSTVAVVGTTWGAVANDKGEYSLTLAPGKYKLQIRYLGYKTRFDSFEINKSMTRDYVLQPEELKLPDVIITKDGKDPAYAIMQQAIKRRNINRNRVQQYAVDCYTKTRIENITEKDILYLSEVYSTLYIQRPYKRKEIIHRSRVSGSRRYSPLGALFFGFDPYAEGIEFGINDRPFVSPLAANAFFTYNFKYLGNYYEKGQNIYKIALLPKRKADPAFDGTIYLAEGSYAIVGIDWQIDRSKPVQYVDSLKLTQTYLPLGSNIWLPFNNSVDGKVNVSAVVKRFSIRANFLNVFSNYRIGAAAFEDINQKKTKPAAPAPPAEIKAADTIAIDSAAAAKVTDNKQIKKFFDEVIEVKQEVPADISVWDSLRPIALDTSETADFIKGDSILAKTNDKKYIDSVNRAENKFKFSSLLFGYSWRNARNGNSISFSSPLNAISFNTVEGWVLLLRAEKRWNLDSNQQKYLLLNGTFRYGFAARQPGFQFALLWRQNPAVDQNWILQGGDYISEFSSFRQISTPINTLYTLLSEQNFLKLYRQQFLQLNYQRKIGKHFTGAAVIFWGNRMGLSNRTNQVWYPNPERSYTPNISLPNHQVFEYIMRLTFDWSPRYITLPEGRRAISSGWPEVTLLCRGGQLRFQNGLSNQRFVLAELKIADVVDLKTLGTLRWQVVGGNYWLADSGLLLPYRYHIQANRTFIFENSSQFGIVDYYKWNATDRYADWQIEHNFQGFWLHKIPIIRKLKLHEVVRLHGLAKPGALPVSELTVGLSNIRLFRFSLLRVNWHYRLTGDNTVRKQAFTIGLELGRRN